MSWPGSFSASEGFAHGEAGAVGVPLEALSVSSLPPHAETASARARASAKRGRMVMESILAGDEAPLRSRRVPLGGPGAAPLQGRAGHGARHGLAGRLAHDARARGVRGALLRARA